MMSCEAEALNAHIFPMSVQCIGNFSSGYSREKRPLAFFRRYLGA